MFTSRSKKSKPRLIDSVRIAAPCDVPFSSMSGDERIRHCQLCKKNVYNISAMSEDEAESLLRSSDNLCLNLYKRADGTVIFDNCPVALRRLRKRLQKTAVFLLLALGLSCLAQRIEAQGLIGAPVEAGGWARPRTYEPVILSNKAVIWGAVLSFAMSLNAGLARVRDAKRGLAVAMLVRRRALEAVILALSAAVLFYLVCLATDWFIFQNF